MEKMAPTMNFSTYQGELKIRYIVWNIPCCKCNSTARDILTCQLRVGSFQLGVVSCELISVSCQLRVASCQLISVSC